MENLAEATETAVVCSELDESGLRITQEELSGRERNWVSVCKKHKNWKVLEAENRGQREGEWARQRPTGKIFAPDLPEWNHPNTSWNLQHLLY